MARARDILKISNFKRFVGTSSGRAVERSSGRGAMRAVGDDG
jgi:hypothetical protein